jgi:hypothetical protein
MINSWVASFDPRIPSHFTSFTCWVMARSIRCGVEPVVEMADYYRFFHSRRCLHLSPISFGTLHNRLTSYCFALSVVDVFVLVIVILEHRRTAASPPNSNHIDRGPNYGFSHHRYFPTVMERWLDGTSNS